MSLLNRLLLSGLLSCLAGCQLSSAAPSWQTAIKNSRWELTSWPEHTVPNGDNGEPVIITFQADTDNTGTVNGFSGCNRFNAHYQMQQQQLTFGPAVTTRMACPSQKMQFEQQLLAALTSVNHYQLQPPYLLLTGVDKQKQPVLLRFYQRPQENAQK